MSELPSQSEVPGWIRNLMFLTICLCTLVGPRMAGVAAGARITDGELLEAWGELEGPDFLELSA